MRVKKKRKKKERTEKKGNKRQGANERTKNQERWFIALIYSVPSFIHVKSGDSLNERMLYTFEWKK